LIFKRQPIFFSTLSYGTKHFQTKTLFHFQYFVYEWLSWVLKYFVIAVAFLLLLLGFGFVCIWEYLLFLIVLYTRQSHKIRITDVLNYNFFFFFFMHSFTFKLRTQFFSYILRFKVILQTFNAYFGKYFSKNDVQEKIKIKTL